jgi:hypothetical protein
VLRWCPGAESNHRHRDFQSPDQCSGISLSRYREFLQAAPAGSLSRPVPPGWGPVHIPRWGPATPHSVSPKSFFSEIAHSCFRVASAAKASGSKNSWWQKFTSRYRGMLARRKGFEPLTPRFEVLSKGIFKSLQDRRFATAYQIACAIPVLCLALPGNAVSSLGNAMSLTERT